MTIEISNDYGKIDISNEVIASVVGVTKLLKAMVL